MLHSCGYIEMDQLKWSTPIKNEHKCEITRSPVIYKTPVKQNETTSKHATYQSSMNNLNVLPSHITPPSGLTKFIARNPFETDLTNRLHLSVISPTVFSKASSPSQCSPDFAWNVHDLALLHPAKIEEFPMQQIHCTDPETEVKAQAAIDKFFKEDKIIPSPWEIRRKENRIKIIIDTPTRTSGNLNLESSKSKKDGWSQTVLSFPSDLPPHVEEILKPYFTFTQEQNVDSDDANSSNNSLRRKLFSNHDDCAENEEEVSVSLSPVKMNGSLILPSSSPQSRMLVRETSLRRTSNGDNDHGNLSSPNISPIHSTVNNMSFESMNNRSRSVARLNFTADMSIDQLNVQQKQCMENEFLDVSLNKDNVQSTQNKMDSSLNLDSNSTYLQSDNYTETKVVSKYLTNIENESSERHFKQQSDARAFQYLTDSCQVYANDNYVLQQTTGTLGTSDQQSVSNFTQDTGYQTNSMSSTTNVIDSYNITPVKQKAYWGDRVPLADDEFSLFDWNENIKNRFCSTPSKSDRERDNHIF